MKFAALNINPVLIIGHPGHELRVYGFIKKYKPAVIVLTDGSGSKSHSRLQQTIDLVRSLGCSFHNKLPVFTDKELYDIILSQDFSPLFKYKELLTKHVEQEGYTTFLGDALEGFNPTHDICSYLINGIVSKLQLRHPDKMFYNYDFVLEAAPNTLSQKMNVGGESLYLNQEEFEMKMAAALDYPELRYEVERATTNFGEDVFKWESYGLVTQLNQLKNWNTEKPYYETFGQKRVEEGSYKSVITFDKHIKPIAELLLNIQDT